MEIKWIHLIYIYTSNRIINKKQIMYKAYFNKNVNLIL